MELLPPEVSERSDTPDSWRSLRRVQQNILDLWRGEAQPELDCRTGEQWGIPLDSALSDTSDDTDDDDEAEVTGAVASSGAIVRLAPAAAAAASTEACGALVYRAIGHGLHTAIAGAITTFTIEAVDEATGQRRRPSPASGSSHGLSVSLTGPAVVRARVYAEDDGTYTGEFRPSQTGKYRLAIMRHGHHLVGSPFALVVKPAPGGLKDWRQSRQREVSSLRAKRAAAKAGQQSKAVRREPSPRISPAEALQKAYELALALARGNRAGPSSAAATRAAEADEHVLAV